jgi:hypothetical protein
MEKNVMENTTKRIISSNEFNYVCKQCHNDHVVTSLDITQNIIDRFNKKKCEYICIEGKQEVISIKIFCQVITLCDKCDEVNKEMVELK